MKPEKNDRFQHNRYKNEAKETHHCDVLLIGDSIVQQMQFTKFYQECLPPGNHFKPKITKCLMPVLPIGKRILNFGIGGDKVEHVLWRIQDGEWLNALKPKIVT
jgi:hypothetical protein